MKRELEKINMDPQFAGDEDGDQITMEYIPQIFNSYVSNQEVIVMRVLLVVDKMCVLIWDIYL